jgi:hypothetical protein
MQRYIVQVAPRGAPPTQGETVVSETEAPTRPTPRPTTEVAHRHHHHHHHHHDPVSAFSLLGTSVATRLGIVAAISVLLWGAIAWALA